MTKQIIQYFPEHKIYIEPFFGAGGIFFNKPKAKYNILNDIDGDVFNLFQVILNRSDEFLELLELAPFSSELFEYWKNNQETDPVRKAVRFVYLSNYGYLGMKNCLNSVASNNSKNIAILNFRKTLSFLKDCSLRFTNYDFRKFLNTISFRNLSERRSAFIYCDPPYLGTANNYSHSFTEQDFIDLLDCLEAMGCKFAVSEFDNEFVLQQAKERGLNVIYIGERQALMTRKTEVLLTNYKVSRLFF